MRINLLEHWRLWRAARVVKTGGIIAYPTEAVFGLGCDPFNPKAVQRLLQLKNRTPDKGLILIAANWQQIESLIDLTALTTEQLTKVKTSWPGPTTWLLPATAKVPRWICGKYTSIAIRLPDHRLAHSLCDYLGGPLVSTSANTSSHSPIRDINELRRQFGKHIDYILPGSLGQLTQPTTIIDAVTQQIIREA
jgi:L-threonylcarbamoyladenylate synthase